MKQKSIPQSAPEVQAEIQCEGFMLQAGKASEVATARAQAQEVLPGSWITLPMGGDGREFLLKPATGGAISKELCWDWAARLGNLAGITDAEPALTSTARVNPIANKKTKAAKSGGGDEVLACAAQDELWSLKKMNVQEAWEISPPTGGSKLGQGIRIGHPDTGYRPHPELTSGGLVRADLGYNFEEDTNNPIDPLDGSSPGHGTATASVIISPRGLQLEGFQRGVSGVAPRAELVPFRVAGNVVHFSMANVARAIHASVDAGCHVVSMSLGGPFSSNALERAILRARDAGVILMAAAGNRWPFVVVPARLDDVLGIAACNCASIPWSGSASGREVNVTAPGESVWRAQVKPDGQFAVAPSSGTSYAVASAAGVCALWLAFHGRDRLLKKYGPQGMIRVFESLLMASTTRPPGWDTAKYGTGIVNAKSLLNRPLPSSAPSSPKAKALAAEATSMMRLQRLEAFFPEVPGKQSHQAVAAAFGLPVAVLADFASEAAFHLWESPKLVAEIRRSLSAAKTKAKTAKVGKSVKANVLSRHSRMAAAASTNLKEAILAQQTKLSVAAKPNAKPTDSKPASTTLKVDKAIITSLGMMRKKYGAAGVKKVQESVGKLVKADAKRGLHTVVFDIQDAELLTRLGLPANTSTNTPTPQQAKAAVDAIHSAHRPDYLMLLGGPDVVPFIPLQHHVPEDPDLDVPSDLPYASDRPYSTDIQIFRAPSRVVGRLPDLRGAKKPDFLLAALAHATTWSARPVTDYTRTPFGLSTESWQQSTRLNLKKLFGSTATAHTSPSSGPSWTKSQLSPLSHFINCHGADQSPVFFGESKTDSTDQPEALLSDGLVKRVSKGCIIAAECCYGAELYDPQIDPDMPELAVAPSIANRYLEQGALAFVGSTNIAYGPADSLGDADWLCHFFFKHVLSGASTGRAMLEARLDFLKQAGHLSPTEQKTIAQFVLLGDPSIHPVQITAVPAKKKAAKATKHAAAKSAMMQQGSEQRVARREQLILRSQTQRAQAGRTTIHADKVIDSMQARILRAAGLDGGSFTVRKTSSFTSYIQLAVSAVVMTQAKGKAKSARKPAAIAATEKQYLLVGERSEAKGSKAKAKLSSSRQLNSRQVKISRYLERAVILQASESAGKVTVKKLYPH